MLGIISAFLYLYLVITEFVHQYPPLGSSTVGTWKAGTQIQQWSKEELKGKITGERDSKTPDGQRKGGNFRINAAEPERRGKSQKEEKKEEKIKFYRYRGGEKGKKVRAQQ
jgi:hypothetical protein